MKIECAVVARLRMNHCDDVSAREIYNLVYPTIRVIRINVKDRKHDSIAMIRRKRQSRCDVVIVRIRRRRGDGCAEYRRGREQSNIVRG